MSLPIAFFVRYISKDFIERSGSRLKARGNFVGQRTWDVLSNLPTVRSHCREAGAVEDYTRCMAYQARVLTQLGIFGGISQPFLHFCDMLCVYVGYYYGGALVQQGLMNTAELMVVVHQFRTVSQELSHMLDTILGSVLVTEHARDVVDLLLSRPKIEPLLFNGSPAPGAFFGRRCHGEAGKLASTTVEFREVVFSYPGTLARVDKGGHAIKDDVRILKGLSFVAEDGEFTAIVGKTGSGKSTVTLLMQRLYDVLEGKVLVGGVDVREQDVRKLRRSIAVVSQEPVLFSTSIYENLLYALEEEKEFLNANEKEERMVEACKKADAWEFVKGFQDGLCTDVGPRGSQLSGGQKQRLTIARAILKRAPLLILDEATSSLDVEAEQSVQRALDNLIGDYGSNGSRGRPITRLVVAHRLSTIRRADKILVIDNGVVREQGSHDELSAKEGGLYARFHRLSTGEEQMSPHSVGTNGTAVTPSSNGHQRLVTASNGHVNGKSRVSATPAGAPEVEKPNFENGELAALQKAYAELRGHFNALQDSAVHEGDRAQRAAEVDASLRRLGTLIERG